VPADLTPLTLDPDTEPWERQPGETVKRFGQFTVYRDAGRVRTLRRAAEALALAPSYVRDVAAAYHWTSRADRWDRHRDQLHEAAWLDARREAAKRDASVLDDAMTKLADRLTTLDPTELGPPDLIRGLDMVLKHRRQLYGDPYPVTLTGPAGGPVQLDIKTEAFVAMPDEQRRAELRRMAEDVLRRAAAAAGEDDDYQ